MSDKNENKPASNAGVEALSSIIFMIIVMIGMYFLSKYMGN